jgi:ubiquinone/menaquinone biosynthesis C-methylase UbiE
MTTATARNTPALDVAELEDKVKAMYRDVATNPTGEFHFEMGRPLTERLGYRTEDLDAIPQEAIESFAGVGYYFDLAALKPGEKVVDLGSGSGTDSLIAAIHVGRSGAVVGIDFTDEQLVKATALRDAGGFGNVTFRKGYIDATGLEAGTCDAVISNGVFNLAPDKPAVFREAARILRTGGRLALADIVTGIRLPEGITCNATLWAACIGGALQIDDYVQAIEAAGFKVNVVRDNAEYRFLSDSAQGATSKFGVKSVSILAVRNGEDAV